MPHERHPAFITLFKWKLWDCVRVYALRPTALLLACGLQFAHANSSPQTIVFGVAPGPYGDMVKQALRRRQEKGYKVVVREF